MLMGDLMSSRPPSNSSRACRASAMVAGWSVEANTASVWPSMTFTRVQVQLTGKSAGSIPCPLTFPNIFCVSTCTFSSSFGMKGMTLSRVSMPLTPGLRPAPDSACMEVMITSCSPNRS